nr:hypothetical protein [Rhodococcus wratislaviensis]
MTQAQQVPIQPFQVQQELPEQQALRETPETRDQKAHKAFRANRVRPARLDLKVSRAFRDQRAIRVTREIQDRLDPQALQVLLVPQDLPDQPGLTVQTISGLARKQPMTL